MMHAPPCTAFSFPVRTRAKHVAAHLERQNSVIVSFVTLCGFWGLTGVRSSLPGTHARGAERATVPKPAICSMGSSALRDSSGALIF